MPLPLGHAAFGIAVVDLLPGRPGPASGWSWKEFFLIAFLANLPDIDVIFGLLFHGNGSVFHRGLTHSVLFALAAGILSARAWKWWSKVPRFGFWAGFLAVFSHITADIMFTKSGVSLFWPFQVYRPLKHKGWMDILNEVIFEAYRDAFIIAGCLLVFLLARWVRGMAVNNVEEM